MVWKRLRQGNKFITTGGDGYPTELFPESKCVKDIKLPGTTDAFLLFLKNFINRVYMGSRVISHTCRDAVSLLHEYDGQIQ